MPLLYAFPLGFLLVTAALLVVWAIQLRTHNAGMVDPVWSWSLGFLGVWFALTGDAPLPLRALLAILAGLWGLRLGTHLFLRNHGKPEDGRYARLREEWGANADRNMFGFFVLQAGFSMALAIGFALVAYRDGMPGWPAQAAAILIWLIAVGGEGLADWQLEQFKKEKTSKGQVCRKGLWYYSRHPNYFFECVHWLAYVPLAFGAPWWGLALVPAGVMAFLLLKMSGIPVTEAQTAKSRPAYAEYIRTTSAFIPWPPKKA